MLATKTNFDFSGYATKANVRCTDGRVILPNAFLHNDGENVPVVWQHGHDAPENVLGNALLENRSDGVYAYIKLNNSPSGKSAKDSVEHKDIRWLSIFANSLVEKGKNVVHGAIKEVSLVISGANPGAMIDNIAFAHSDGGDPVVDETEAIIYSGDEISFLSHDDSEDTDEPNDTDEITHADEDAAEGSDKKEETLNDILETMDEKQKDVLYMLVGRAIETKDDADMEHSSITQTNQEGDLNEMKKNAFDIEVDNAAPERRILTHDDMKAINSLAWKTGKLSDAVLQHAGTYGIDDIDFLFPEAQMITPEPQMYGRKMEWVKAVFDGAHKSPFSKIKSVVADITADEARAKGYVKGALKLDEVLVLLKRVTNPTTVYKKQKLDRDDVIDITDMDIVAWLKMEMRVMLEEELARAILVGDGRSPAAEDHIDSAAIRPIYGDDALYAVQLRAAVDATTSDVIDSVVAGRAQYQGSGNPTFFATPAIVSDMLLLKDTTGRRLYANMNDLAAALRVSNIVEVPVLENIVEDIDGSTGAELLGIVVNMNDYYVGADKGGAVSLFDDFDIDYNQYKYLIETRASGALVRPKSAMVVERIIATP